MNTTRKYAKAALIRGCLGLIVSFLSIGSLLILPTLIRKGWTAAAKLAYIISIPVKLPMSPIYPFLAYLKKLFPAASDETIMVITGFAAITLTWCSIGALAGLAFWRFKEISKKLITERIKKLGVIALIVAAGIFILWKINESKRMNKTGVRFTDKQN